ncbi:MAG: hypothetical protein UZ21_OP11001000435 [Microgenomates bacterium OLB22]|nr:MAG: hypothetical protein UZ21_OP11001000435 [Microgenomates bacterium OLB22]
MVSVATVKGCKMLGTSAYRVEYVLQGHASPVKTTMAREAFGPILRAMDMYEARTIGGRMPYGNLEGELILPEGDAVPDGFVPCTLVRSVNERYGVMMTYKASRTTT